MWNRRRDGQNCQRFRTGITITAAQGKRHRFGCGRRTMAFDLIIRQATVVGPHAAGPLAIGVSQGRVVELAPEICGVAREEIDATGMYVFPGVIDAHVHFNEPGREDWEGIASGSAAVAAGGGVCWMDMPLNSSPPTVTAEAFDLKLARARAASRTDFALWGGLVPGHLDDMEPLAERGVVGFKAFMCSSGIDDFPAADDHTLYEGMKRAAALGLPVAVHAENEALVTALAREALAAGRVAARDYLRSRPWFVEMEAVGRALRLAEAAGCRLHIVHVSWHESVDLVAEAAARGVDATCETCPHYLVLNEGDVERLGPVAKCAPALRTADEAERLWAKVEGGQVCFIASDHSPSPPSMKASANFFQAWGGIAGAQSLLPILLHAGHARRKQSLDELARLTSAAVASRFGLPSKGRIALGCDADFALVDLARGEPLRKEHLLYRHQVTPYVGLPIHGLIRRTIVRGQTVFMDGGRDSGFRGELVRPAHPAGLSPAG